MNPLDKINPISAITNLAKGTLDKKRRAHALAVAGFTEAEEQIKALGLELQAARQAYSQAIEAGDEPAARRAVTDQGDVQLKLDIARSQLKKREQAAAEAHTEWTGERLKASQSTTEWESVKKRIAPSIKDIIAARKKLSAAVAEIRAIGDELATESELQRQLLRANGNFVGLSHDHLLAVVIDAVGRECEGDLSGPALAPWIANLDAENRATKVISLLQRSGLSWKATGGEVRAAELLANGPEGR